MLATPGAISALQLAHNELVAGQAESAPGSGTEDQTEKIELLNRAEDLQTPSRPWLQTR